MLFESTVNVANIKKCQENTRLIFLLRYFLERLVR